ncbi:MAG: hypothetical protein LLF76_04945 [Planctomycetaceae bacterium]|nr:hypothetical protein [Planctomycetaceae bacterium]
MKKTCCILLMVGSLLVMAGCVETSRKETAELRWQETIDHARIEAAKESIRQGQLGFAEKLLEDVSDSSSQADQAKKILAQIDSNDARM